MVFGHVVDAQDHIGVVLDVDLNVVKENLEQQNTMYGKYLCFDSVNPADPSRTERNFAQQEQPRAL